MDTYVEKDSAVHAMIVFRHASRVIDKHVGQSIRNANLTFPQFGVLDVLYTKGDMTVNDLMNKVLATAGNMTVILKNMERDKLIYRYTSKEDKRKHIIGITDLGKAKYESVLPGHRQEIEQVFSILSDEDRSELISILKQFKKYN